ncbi:MAG: hypothetical protein F6K17_18740 [Okeania sp. SIO3C4]|nr:hypothetical protein [Okeania sp. SIO3C4]
MHKINSLFIRIKNLIDEVHKKVAKWLTTEYRIIFLPTFESSQMVAKSGKKKRQLNSCVSSPNAKLGTNHVSNKL